MKYFITFIMLCSLFSCKTSLFQVQTTTSNNLKTDSVNNFIYEDSLVAIKYNLWSQGGAVSLSIFNKTGSPLYIDWSKSNISSNGRSLKYLIGRGSFSIDSSNGKSSIRYASRKKPQTVIPPFDYIELHVFNLCRKTTLNTLSTFHNDSTDKVAYTHQNTPLNFENNIVISKQTDYSSAYTIKNTFWVSETHNYRAKQFNTLQHPANSFYARKHVLNRGGTAAVALAAANLGGLIYYYFEYNTNWQGFLSPSY